MGFKSALQHLKSTLQGGEHSIHTYQGLPPETERQAFQQASNTERRNLVQHWLRHRIITVDHTLTVYWKKVVFTLHHLPKHLIH